MSEERDTYERLKAWPTPEDEFCTCPDGTPIKLMWALGPNPIRCLRCNGEVRPERLSLSVSEVSAVGEWSAVAGAIEMLELDSGAYEEWARRQLLDPQSPVNIDGREVVAMLNEKERCYFWFFQQQSDDDFVPLSTCPYCGEPLTRYDDGIFPQLLCEKDSFVVVGASG